jgi:CHAD domain-containing protein
MSSGSKKLLRRLAAERSALLHCYEDESLHQLRITLRRIRSLLRCNAGHKAQDLRHRLGRLADMTNAARDWDTVVSRARASLSPREFRLLQPWLDTGAAASHRPVLDMLCGDDWTDVAADLKAFFRDAGSTLERDRRKVADLSRPKREICHAWRKVQSRDDNRSWHKLRLAVKELRYKLKALPKDDRDTAMSAALKHCRQVQEYLGIWHDTVVHLRMVREFAERLDPQVDVELLAVLGDWSRSMEREARDYLEKAGLYVQGEGAELLR